MIDYKKYKSYILVGAGAFALGFILAGIGSRGELQSLRVRASQYETNYNRARADLQSYKKQFADLKATIGAAGKTTSDATNTTGDIKESNRAIGKSIDTAIRAIESSGDGFRELKRIISGIQERRGN